MHVKRRGSDGGLRVARHHVWQGLGIRYAGRTMDVVEDCDDTRAELIHAHGVALGALMGVEDAIVACTFFDDEHATTTSRHVYAVLAAARRAAVVSHDPEALCLVGVAALDETGHAPGILDAVRHMVWRTAARPEWTAMSQWRECAQLYDQRLCAAFSNIT